MHLSNSALEFSPFHLPVLLDLSLAPRDILTWPRLATAALALTLVSLCCAAAAPSLTYETYTSPGDGAVSYAWVLAGCYAAPRGCDAPHAARLAYAAVAFDAALLLVLGTLAAQAAIGALAATPAAFGDTAWARAAMRSAGVAVGVTRVALLAGALGAKEAELAGYAAFAEKAPGWACLVAALVAGVAQLPVLVLLATDDAFESSAARAAAALAVRKAVDEAHAGAAELGVADLGPRAAARAASPAAAGSPGSPGARGARASPRRSPAGALNPVTVARGDPRLALAYAHGGARRASPPRSGRPAWHPPGGELPSEAAAAAAASAALAHALHAGADASARAAAAAHDAHAAAHPAAHGLGGHGTFRGGER
jgi:hypothetical protein